MRSHIALSPLYAGQEEQPDGSARRCRPADEPLRYEHEPDTQCNVLGEECPGLSRLTAAHSRVDDDLVFGDAAARWLRAAGFEVFLAPDHRLALQDLESTRSVDLLITDIVMSERVNGVALSRMARMRRPELKVIYLTAYDIPGVEDEAAGPVLRKPIDDERLLAEVRRVLTTADAGSTGKPSGLSFSTG